VADVVRIGRWSRPVERGGQAMVDRCGPATLVWGPWPAETLDQRPTWLAGHSHCGFGWWATLPVGTPVMLSGPHGDATYVVSGRQWVPRKGGTSEGLIGRDLTLQTCLARGTAFTYATRVG
jgi:hypothetical protein